MVLKRKSGKPVGGEHRIEIQKLCMHELGHYVAGRALGAEPTQISITFRGHKDFLGNTSMSLVRPLATVEDVRAYLEDRICILNAGTLGEHLSIDPITRALFNEDGWIPTAATNYARELSSASDKSKGDELLRMMVLMDGVEETVDESVLDASLAVVSKLIWSKAAAMLGGVAWEFYVVGDMMADRILFLDTEVVMTRGEIEEFFEAARNMEGG